MALHTRNRFLYGSLGLLFVLLLFTECRKDKILTAPSARLEFSTDTVQFDTVFTTIGSVTRELKIYNDHSQPIIINRADLAGGEGSMFRMNLDGMPGDHHEAIEIPANDSLFLFVEVTVDPNNANTPMVVEDSIIFRTNGNRQQVKLVAWGQDAHFHSNVIYGCNGGNGILQFSNDKPHVIYGTVAIDTNCVLSIQEGTQVHFHPNSRLVVLKDGRIEVNGTKNNKVVFQGDRLESIYEDEPGQWERIWLIENDDSYFQHAIIKNSIIGLQVDTVGSNGNPSVTLDNTIIQNASSAGLLAQAGAHVVANNSLFADCGEYTAALSSGGEYHFTHCTFANYWTFASRETPAFLLTNHYEDASGNREVRPITNSEFVNCLFYGTQEDEFIVDTDDEEATDFLFDHCLVRTSESTSGNQYQSVIRNEDPLFESTSGGPLEHDFHLQSGSPAIDAGKSTSLSGDLDENARDGDPDLGAYEK